MSAFVTSSPAGLKAGGLHTKCRETVIFEDLVFARQCAMKHVHTLSDSIRQAISQERDFNYPHFTDVETEAWGKLGQDHTVNS